MGEYEFHPAANLFPMMPGAELDALGEDMLQHGQREPIILYHGQILDGRNRYRACILKGIEPKFQSELPPDPYTFVATVNLHRRHLSEEHRGMIAARLATMRQGARTDLSPNGETSQAKAAELLKVSKRRVERSHEVIEKGVPDLVDAVERRDVKVSAAAAFVKSMAPLDQTRLIAEHGSPAAAVKATVKTKADRAASKMSKSVPDPKRAADRADRNRTRYQCLKEMLQGFLAMESCGNPAQVANAVRQLETRTFQNDTVCRLRRVAAFANEVVILVEGATTGAVLPQHPDARHAEGDGPR